MSLCYERDTKICTKKYMKYNFVHSFLNMDISFHIESNLLKFAVLFLHIVMTQIFYCGPSLCYVTLNMMLANFTKRFQFFDMKLKLRPKYII